jgi:hypothetical protein
MEDGKLIAFQLRRTGELNFVLLIQESDLAAGELSQQPGAMRARHAYDHIAPIFLRMSLAGCCEAG